MVCRSLKFLRVSFRGYSFVVFRNTMKNDCPGAKVSGKIVPAAAQLRMPGELGGDPIAGQHADDRSGGVALG